MKESLTDENFDQETFDSSDPVLVFFGAERCSVCKELMPVVEEIAGDYTGRLKVCWVDVDQYRSLFKRFRLRGIPTLLLFKNGEAEDRIGGLHPKEELASRIDRLITSRTGN